MSDTVETITREDRPGWRARIVYDTHAGEPWGDALAPTLVIEYNGTAYYGAEVHTPADAEHIEAAWNDLADRHGRHDAVEIFTRYLRAWHGVTTVEKIDSRDGFALIFDTADWRELVGMTQTPADLSGELTEWEAYFTGAVYGVVVERHRTGVVSWSDHTTDHIAEWSPSESVWGLYGDNHATESAREMLDDASRPTTADELSTRMDFDHVVRVDSDGIVSDAPGIHAPELYGETIMSDAGWKLLAGYSGQYAYSGPVMHASEYIGGQLAAHILSTPGLYVTLVVYGEDHLDDQVGHRTDDDEPAGWAVAFLDE